MIGKSVLEISCDKDEFEKAKRNYSKGLAKVGSSEKIKYHKQSPVKREKLYGLILHTVALSKQMYERSLLNLL